MYMQFMWISHFRVPKTLTFKTRPSAKPLWWKWVLFAYSYQWFGIKPRFEVEAMFTLLWIAFEPTRNIPNRASPLLFTHKNGDCGVISVTKRSCAAPISKVERHISDRCWHDTGYLFVAALKAIRFSINIAELKQLGNGLFYHAFSLLPYLVSYEDAVHFLLFCFT